MKKVFKSRVFIVIITLIIGVSGTLYATTKYQASEVLYNPIDSDWNVNNVNDALDNLYESKTELDNIKGMGNASSGDIATGKTAVVQGKLVTGTKSNPIITTNFTATSDGYADVYIYGYAFNLQNEGVYTSGVINVYEDSTVVATLTVSKSGSGKNAVSKLVQIPIKKGCRYYSTITQLGWLENSGSTVAASVVFSYVAE